MNSFFKQLLTETKRAEKTVILYNAGEDLTEKFLQDLHQGLSMGATAFGQTYESIMIKVAKQEGILENPSGLNEETGQFPFADIVDGPQDSTGAYYSVKMSFHDVFTTQTINTSHASKLKLMCQDIARLEDLTTFKIKAGFIGGHLSKTVAAGENYQAVGVMSRIIKPLYPNILFEADPSGDKLLDKIFVIDSTGEKIKELTDRHNASSHNTFISHFFDNREELYDKLEFPLALYPSHKHAQTVDFKDDVLLLSQMSNAAGIAIKTNEYKGKAPVPPAVLRLLRPLADLNAAQERLYERMKSKLIPDENMQAVKHAVFMINDFVAAGGRGQKPEVAAKYISDLEKNMGDETRRHFFKVYVPPPIEDEEESVDSPEDDADTLDSPEDDLKEWARRKLFEGQVIQFPGYEPEPEVPEEDPEMESHIAAKMDIVNTTIKIINKLTAVVDEYEDTDKIGTFVEKIADQMTSAVSQGEAGVFRAAAE